MKDTQKEKDNLLILLNNDSKFKLNKTNGTLETICLTTKKNIKVTFSKSSMIYKLLDGRSLIKINYRKDRLIAIKVDNKMKADVLSGTELEKFEKSAKLSKYNKFLIFKNSLGIS